MYFYLSRVKIDTNGKKSPQYRNNFDNFQSFILFRSFKSISFISFYSIGSNKMIVQALALTNFVKKFESRYQSIFIDRKKIIITIILFYCPTVQTFFAWQWFLSIFSVWRNFLRPCNSQAFPRRTPLAWRPASSSTASQPLLRFNFFRQKRSSLPNSSGDYPNSTLR